MLLAVACLATTILVSSCRKKPKCDGTNSTYNSNIKTIIDSHCTNPSCHGSGSPNGDFRTYNGIKPKLTSGAFKEQVLDKRTMPQGSSLSKDELSKIACWSDHDYPEK